MEKQLLLVEDETAIARLLQDNLTYEGYRVELAKDGPEALRKVDEFLPDELAAKQLTRDGAADRAAE